MHALNILILTKLRILKGTLCIRNKNAQIRNISTIIVLGAMLYAAYLFFHDLIFTYVINLEEIGYLLIERLVSVGFLGFFFMLIISSFAIALATLFRSTETEFLFSTPTSVLVLFTSKYIDIVVYSSWAILIMALPILYSYAKVRDFGTKEFALTGLVVLFPFIIIATALGTLFAVIGVKVSKHLSFIKLITASAIVFSVLIYAVIHFAQPTQLVIPFTEDFRALNIFINNFRLNSHPLTPNFWLIQSLRALVFHEYTDFVLYASALVSSAVFFLTLLYAVADRIFFNTWLVSSEESLIKKRRNGDTMRLRSGFLAKPTNSQVRALLAKDILLFIRDPGQWAQLFLLLALLALYFVNLHFIPEDIEIAQWRTIISVMNFAFCGFFLATMAVRFVYTSISLEGGAIWVLGSSPLSTATLFREKFWLSFFVFLILTECIALISGTILKLEWLYQFLTTSGILLMSIALASLAVGFGAAFPDFTEHNPSRIASSTGGILTIITSLFYIGLMLIMLAIPSYKYTEYIVGGGVFPLRWIIISAVCACVLNAGIVFVPLWVGAKSLAKREL